MTDSEIFDIHIELTFYKPIGDYNGGNLQGKRNDGVIVMRRFDLSKDEGNNENFDDKIIMTTMMVMIGLITMMTRNQK
jgi:hypothetical protein